MKLSIEVAAGVAGTLVNPNSIHLGNFVATKLREKRVPIMGGIVPAIDPARATGSLVWTTNPDNSITVTADWQPLPFDDDDDEL